MPALLLKAVVLGIATAATPLGVLGVVLALGSAKGLRLAVPLALGLASAVSLAGAIAALVSSRVDVQALSDSRTGVWASIVIGVAVVAFGVWVWVQPAQEVGGFVKKAFDALDRTKPIVAFLIGTMLVNLVPAFLLVTMIAASGVGVAQGWIVWFVFFAIGTTCVWVPIVVRLGTGDAWDARAEVIRRLAIERGSAVFGIAMILIGAWTALEAAVKFLPMGR